MKRLLSAALALSLLGGTAAYADPHGHRGGHHGGSHHHRHHHDGNDTGTAIAVGVGLLALTAILASQDRDNGRYEDDAAPYQDEYAAPPADENAEPGDGPGAYEEEPAE